jgi:membrane-bound serine protease (ClpP class)
MILLSIGLFIADVYAPTHGALTVGGIVAFFLGALMLFYRAEPFLRLSLSYLIPATALTAAFFVFVVAAGLRAQFLPVRVGAETMLGKTVTALAPIHAQKGKVFVDGEYWNAVSDTPIAEGQPVEITAIEGLTLTVKPKTK